MENKKTRLRCLVFLLGECIILNMIKHGNNEEVKNEILKYLLECKSIFVWGNLDTVAVDLSHVFPISEVINWLSPDTTNTTDEIFLDDRSTSVVFLRRLMEQELRDHNERLGDGTNHLDVQKITNKLRRLSSFEIAINNWLSICVDWLAVCNVNEILERLRERRSIPQDTNIAKLLAGARELAIW